MFDNFVSLGSFCGVAGSMSKCGLRSFSAPFDWIITDLCDVIRCMDDDFAFFLKKENLKLSPNGKNFIDNAYNFRFFHEDPKSINEHYDILCTKYQHKIEQFRRQIKKKTCFIRAIQNPDEIAYINSNFEYIKRVIQKSNPENDIVYLHPQFLSCPPPQHSKSFELKINRYPNQWYEELRGLFDTNDDLLLYFSQNIDNIPRYQNLLFDQEKIKKALEKNLLQIDKDIAITQSRLDLSLKLKKKDWNSPIEPLHKDIIIYGVGNIGKAFYYKIKNKYNVRFFIDEYTNAIEFDGIPIIHLQDLNPYCAETVIVTPTYDFHNICSKIRAFNNQIKLLSLDDIL